MFNWFLLEIDGDAWVPWRGWMSVVSSRFEGWVDQDGSYLWFLAEGDGVGSW